MRTATTNSDVIRTCEAKMRESGRTIGWFEQSLRDLEGRSSPGPTTSNSSNSLNSTASNDPRINRNLPPPPPGAGPGYAQQQYGTMGGGAGGGSLPPGAGIPGGSYGGKVGGDGPDSRPKPVYTNLGTSAFFLNLFPSSLLRELPFLSALMRVAPTFVLLNSQTLSKPILR